MRVKGIKLFVTLIAVSVMSAAFGEEVTSAKVEMAKGDDSKHLVEIQPNILDILLGVYGGSTQVSINPHFAFGVMGRYMQGVDFKLGDTAVKKSGFSVGPKATYYSQSIGADSWTLVAQAPYSQETIEYKSGLLSGASTRVKYLALDTMGGHRWVWESGVFLSFALGTKTILTCDVELSSSKKTKFEIDVDGATMPTGDISIGIVF